MEIKQVFRALQYKPKYLAKKDRPLGSRRVLPVVIVLLLGGMVVGGIWLTKVVETNISKALADQIRLVEAPRPAPILEPVRQPEQAQLGEQQITFEPEYIVRPIEFDLVLRGIGWLRHPRFGYWLHHDGIDLAVRPGAVMRSVAPGNVTEIIRNYDEEGLGTAGNRITLSHGERGESVYIFPGEVGVRPGDTVTTGSALGTIRSGQAGSVPVHIGVTWDGKQLDWLDILENRG